MYKVISQFTPNTDLTIPTEPERYDKSFERQIDAVDYYIQTIKSMGELIADVGGEFVITMISYTGAEPEVVKRHVLSTTTLVP